MNPFTVLIAAAHYGVIFPGIFICIVPVADWISIPLRKLFSVLIPVMAAICLILGCVESTGNYGANLFFFPLLSVCLIVYFITVRLSNLKLWYLFLCATAALSFGCIANDYIIAYTVPSSNVDDSSVPGLLLQYAISFLIMFLFIVIKDKLKWIFENVNQSLFWRLTWIIPAIITFCNIFMLPKDYNNIRVGRVFVIAMVIEVVLFIFFITFQILLYLIAVTTAQKIKADTTSIMYRAQASQYVKLQNYLDQSRQERHDFKHTIAVMQELAQSGQYEELKNYMADYQLETGRHSMQYLFCQNMAVNAVISYYASLAESCHIKMDFKVIVPRKISISDVDLSLLFGNLLENAIHACCQVPVENRYIHLSSDLNSPGTIYITMVNSFNGIAKKMNGQFLSTTESGSGIGLLSIQTTAERYHGSTRFYNEETEFISNIMLRLS